MVHSACVSNVDAVPLELSFIITIITKGLHPLLEYAIPTGLPKDSINTNRKASYCHQAGHVIAGDDNRISSIGAACLTYLLPGTCYPHKRKPVRSQRPDGFIIKNITEPKTLRF